MKDELYDVLMAYMSSFTILFLGAGFLKLAAYLIGISISYWEIFGVVLGIFVIITLLKIFITGVKR